MKPQTKAGSRFDVILTAVGKTPAKVAKALAETADLSADEAKDFVDSGAAMVIQAHISENEAEEIRRRFDDMGATVAIGPSRRAAGGMTLVPGDALSEIRVTIHHSLEQAINMCLECTSYSAADAAELIRPAVERLEAICEENRFPE